MRGSPVGSNIIATSVGFKDVESREIVLKFLHNSPYCICERDFSVPLLSASDWPRTRSSTDPPYRTHVWGTKSYICS